MYQFDGGAVTLTCINGMYRVSVNGDDDADMWTDQLLRNPRLAVQRFRDAVGAYMLDKMRPYIVQTHRNPVTGCSAHGISCADCISSGRYREISDCMHGDM